MRAAGPRELGTRVEHAPGAGPPVEARGRRGGFRVHLRAALGRPPRRPSSASAGAGSEATVIAGRGGAQGHGGATLDLLETGDGRPRHLTPGAPGGAGTLATAGLALEAGPGPTGLAPADAVAHAEAARAAVAWIARCAVAAAAAPGLLRLHLEDRRLGRVALQVRVRGRQVTVRLAAAPDARDALLAEAGALEAALARRGLVLETLR